MANRESEKGAGLCGRDQSFITEKRPWMDSWLQTGPPPLACTESDSAEKTEPLSHQRFGVSAALRNRVWLLVNQTVHRRVHGGLSTGRELLPARACVCHWDCEELRPRLDQTPRDNAGRLAQSTTQSNVNERARVHASLSTAPSEPVDTLAGEEPTPIHLLNDKAQSSKLSSKELTHCAQSPSRVFLLLSFHLEDGEVDAPTAGAAVTASLWTSNQGFLASYYTVTPPEQLKLHPEAAAKSQSSSSSSSASLTEIRVLEVLGGPAFVARCSKSRKIWEPGKPRGLSTGRASCQRQERRPLCRCW